jgi:hypothetical protein
MNRFSAVISYSKVERTQCKLLSHSMIDGSIDQCGWISLYQESSMNLLYASGSPSSCPLIVLPDGSSKCLDHSYPRCKLPLGIV